MNYYRRGRGLDRLAPVAAAVAAIAAIVFVGVGMWEQLSQPPAEGFSGSLGNPADAFFERHRVELGIDFAGWFNGLVDPDCQGIVVDEISEERRVKLVEAGWTSKAGGDRGTLYGPGC